jgi:hypothetical protein
MEIAPSSVLNAGRAKSGLRMQPDAGRTIGFAYPNRRLGSRWEYESDVDVWITELEQEWVLDARAIALKSGRCWRGLRGKGSDRNKIKAFPVEIATSSRIKGWTKRLCADGEMRCMTVNVATSTQGLDGVTKNKDSD